MPPQNRIYDSYCRQSLIQISASYRQQYESVLNNSNLSVQIYVEGIGKRTRKGKGKKRGGEKKEG